MQQKASLHDRLENASLKSMLKLHLHHLLATFRVDCKLPHGNTVEPAAYNPPKNNERNPNPSVSLWPVMCSDVFFMQITVLSESLFEIVCFTFNAQPTRSS